MTRSLAYGIITQSQCAAFVRKKHILLVLLWHLSIQSKSTQAKSWQHRPSHAKIIQKSAIRAKWIGSTTFTPETFTPETITPDQSPLESITPGDNNPWWHSPLPTFTPGDNNPRKTITPVYNKFILVSKSSLVLVTITTSGLRRRLWCEVRVWRTQCYYEGVKSVLWVRDGMSCNQQRVDTRGGDAYLTRW